MVVRLCVDGSAVFDSSCFALKSGDPNHRTDSIVETAIAISHV